MKENLKSKLFIGTSGIAVPGNKKAFPPDFHSKSRLNYYATHFNSIEINSTFYQTPMPATFLKWALDVPEDFKFTIKLSKQVTHGKDLQFDLKIIDAFCAAAAALANKKGMLLLQFPGKISIQYFTQVEAILAQLDKQLPQNKWRTAIEFRNADWYVSETVELLAQYNSSLVLHDFSKAKNAFSQQKTKTVYLRFHGPAGDYRGSYTDQFLALQADNINEWVSAQKNVYVYFNNTMGNAWQNALALKAFCQERGSMAEFK